MSRQVTSDPRRRKMSVWNYVVTAHKPTTVTHSCVGNFTDPRDINLVIAKCTRIEIHSLNQERLQQILDVPIYGRIAALELFRPNGAQQDYLFISTEKYKFCVLQWDTETGQFITRAMGDVSDPDRLPADFRQIGMIDPDGRAIGFHVYNGLFKAIPLDNNGQPSNSFNIRIEEIAVLDIKFLYGCSKPTIAVLYQHPLRNFPGIIEELHVKTYEVDLSRNVFNNGPWSQSNVCYGAGILLPVDMPLGGVIIISEQKIVYCSASVSPAIFRRLNCITITKAYGRVDGSRYLLGDHTGKLYLLSIIHENLRVTRLDLRFLGETSTASAISYLADGFVYVGSSYGDSQLIKLCLEPNARGSNVEVLETYVNLGPIVDFCVVDIDKRPCGGEQVVTCSGGFKDSSLRILRSGIGFNEKASQDFRGIKGIWPLQSSTTDIFDRYLVVSFVGQTRLLSIRSDNELEETEETRFARDVQTLFCHNAIHDQLVQVTSSFVRLVSASSKMLLVEWRTSIGSSIITATANLTQVLITIGGGHLVYLEIGEESLVEVKHLETEFEVSCIDVNPAGENPIRSEFAVVGLWKDYSIRLYSLPNLEFLTRFRFAENVVPRSVLLYKFEGISYLLCGLGDGTIYDFKLNISNGQLFDRNKMSLGTKAVSFTTFRSKNKTHLFASSDRPAVIYSDNHRLLCRNVHLTDVTHMCSFNTVYFPDTVVIVKEDKFSVGSMDDIQKLDLSSVPLGEQAYRICYQEKSQTLAVCTEKCNYDRNNFVRLFDDKKFVNISSYSLDAHERGSCILSCSFTDDNNFYYCVGTAYVFDEENEPKKGRILVFSVENGQLQLVSKTETEGAVLDLNAFQGKLVAGIKENIVLYKWIIHDDGSRGFKCECVHRGRILAFRVQSRGDFILVADLFKVRYFLVYKNEQGSALEERAPEQSEKWVTAIEILDDDIYLGAEDNFNLFTARKYRDASTEIEGVGKSEVEGEYHLGEFVNRFRHGSLAPPVSASESGDIPTVMFGTRNGMVGVIASLPEDQYQTLEKLQMNLVKVIEGVGRLSHGQWRSFSNENANREAKKFLDGDFIESFLDLDKNHKEEIATAMDVPEEDLCRLVARLTGLH